MKPGHKLSEREIEELSMHFAKELTHHHAPYSVHPDSTNWIEPIQETVNVFYRALDAFLDAFGSQNEEREGEEFVARC
jgi:hypothetical protein